MLIDIFRSIVIIAKFLFKDLWVGLYNLLIGKQNHKIKQTYNKRVKSKKRLWINSLFILIEILSNFSRKQYWYYMI
jgi:hypothetical protein